ncbi:hypothetical protein K458DRAFT_381718 [Lentithecium fluviatile CBS 122367]|uniref:TPR-like protein n=1 Tax=Lentithecium fluviatile CBS 122367 TaxID=1168545 RepID=A0A6G1JMV4_9PLEO|nr:hypothetical protein K458DRAFT_381718 [Lentithecium fluviatile CBS 122367]
MSPKRKDLLNPKAKTKAKSKTPDPQTENDFLEAADEHEQAAGKWRAGDAGKATRFFNRAIDVYNEGMRRFPRSFDLAYNKANLEYNMCEDDRIVAQLGNKMALLEETLKSHRAAMALNTANTDVRFNTGQVLTSLVEAILESETQQVAKVTARTLLEEAVDLFTECLASQQQEYEQMTIEVAKAQAEQGFHEQEVMQQQNEATRQEDMETASTSSSAPGEWVTVEEPLTPEAILETCTAHLSAFTTLLGLYDPAELPSIEARVQHGLYTANTSVPTLITLIKDSPFQKSKDEPAGPTLSIGSSITAQKFETTPKDDALLAVANFQAALAEIAYRNGQTDVTQYASAIEILFSQSTSFTELPHQNPPLLNSISAYADALMDLASAIADNPSNDPSSATFTTSIETQWTALSQAQKILTQISPGGKSSTLPPSRLADTFLARGDIELFRFRLALTEGAKPAWVNSKEALVTNAGVFYRGARTYGQVAHKEVTIRMAEAKVVVAEVLREVEGGGGAAIAAKEQWKGKGEGVKRALEQMVEEGVMGRAEAEGVLALVQ